MYQYNFRQYANTENLYERWLLLASDDGSAIQNDQCIVTVQMWARSARGAGDQSQFFGGWPFIYGGGYNAVPAFTAATNDGTTHLTLFDGVLELNIPAATLQRLLPGYYECGGIIQNLDQTHTAQLFIGVVPIYNGTCWNTDSFSF